MQTRHILPPLLLTLLAACSQQAPPPPFEVVLDAHHTMELIVYPAADLLWESAGTIIDAEGEHDLSPTTDAGWEEVERNAGLLAEAGNLLMLPGRSKGADWDHYSQGLIRTGRQALAAAQAQDAEALFDAGGAIYQECKGCHEQYWMVIDKGGE
ncbi:MAG: hypothetical protein ABJ308_09235 [Halieaceae bacterium]